MASMKCMQPQTASTITILRDCNGNTAEEFVGVTRQSFITRVKLHRYSKLEFFLAVISLLLLVALVVVIVVLETEKSDGSTSDDKLKKPVQAIRNLALVLNNMDRNANPCTDFYQYSCGGWLQKNYLDDSQPFLFPYLNVANENKRKLKEILENTEIKSKFFANPGILQVFKMYSSCINTTALDSVGDSKLRELLVALVDFNISKNRRSDYDWQNFVVKIKRRTDVDVFFKLSVVDDLRIGSLKRIMMQAVQLPLNYGDYAAQNFTPEAKQRRERYLQFMTDVMAMVASSENKTFVKQKMEKVLDLETNIAKKQIEPSQRKNISLIYNLVSIEKLSNITGKFDWLSFLSNLTSGLGYVLTPQELLITSSPKMVVDILNLLNRTDPSVISNYLAWRIVYSLIEVLPSKYRNVYSSYRNAQTKPRWDTCVEETSKTLPLGTSLLFAQYAIPEDTVSEARNIIRDIKDLFIKILPEQSWLDKVSQKGAVEKARSMIFHLAYPENMAIDATSLKNGHPKFEVDNYYFTTYTNIKSIEFMEHFKSLKAAKNRNEYLEEEPMKPTAYYYRTRNQIGISVGFLNDQLFSLDNFASVKFGILGFLAGHEISHGYDSQGHAFDKNGDPRNWMSNDSSKNIFQKHLCLKKSYSNLTYKGDKVGEVGDYRQQYCDIGGLTLALEAYKKWKNENNEEQMLPGLDFTHNQLFFLSYAQMWCAKYQDYVVRPMVKEGSYPFPLRVRGTVMNSREFADAFSCSQGTPMNPDVKCKCNYCNLPVDGRVKYACTLDEYCEYGDHGGKGQSPVSFKWNGFFFILFMTMYIIGFRK